MATVDCWGRIYRTFEGTSWAAVKPGSDSNTKTASQPILTPECFCPRWFGTPSQIPLLIRCGLRLRFLLPTVTTLSHFSGFPPSLPGFSDTNNNHTKTTVKRDRRSRRIINSTVAKLLVLTKIKHQENQKETRHPRKQKKAIAAGGWVVGGQLKSALSNSGKIKTNHSYTLQGN